jgi:hypothetical protein
MREKRKINLFLKIHVSKRRSEISTMTEIFGTIEKELEELEEVISSSWTQAHELGWRR